MRPVPRPASHRTSRRNASHRRCYAPESNGAGRRRHRPRMTPLPGKRDDHSRNSTPFPALHRSAVDLPMLGQLSRVRGALGGRAAAQMTPHWPALQASTGLVSTGLVSTGLVSTGLVSTGLVSTGLVSTVLGSAALVSTALVSTGLVSTGLVSTGLVSTGLVSTGLVST